MGLISFLKRCFGIGVVHQRSGVAIHKNKPWNRNLPPHTPPPMPPCKPPAEVSRTVLRAYYRVLKEELARLKKENVRLTALVESVADDYQDIGKELYYESVAHDATKAKLDGVFASNATARRELEKVHAFLACAPDYFPKLYDMNEYTTAVASLTNVMRTLWTV